MIGEQEIQTRFGHHAAAIEGPNPNEEIHKKIRQRFLDLARSLDRILPDSRQKSVMFTELEGASMWAHKALASSGLDPLDILRLVVSDDAPDEIEE